MDNNTIDYFDSDFDAYDEADYNLAGAESPITYSFLSQLPAVCAQLIFELMYYPFDTWKTGLQYKAIYGIDQPNGIRQIYRGFFLTMFSTILIVLLCNFALGMFAFMPFILHENVTIDGILYNVSIKISILLIYLIASTLFVPREVIKIRHQLSKAPLSSLNVIREIYRTNGLKNGLFRGYWIAFVAMAIDILHNMMNVRVAILLYLESPQILYETIFFVLVLAILPPIDLVKTAIQTHDVTAVDLAKNKDDLHLHQLRRCSCATVGSKNNTFMMLDCLYRKIGISTLYAGLTPIVIRMLLVTLFCRFIRYIALS